MVSSWRPTLIGSLSPTQIWTFDSLSNIGGLVPHIEGQPVLFDSPYGPALAFNGVDDAVVLDCHPLAGASTFTFEALFRPDGGAFAQRWFHLASNDTGHDAASTSATRCLFEIRVIGGDWYLDAFIQGPGYKQTLVSPEKRFAVGKWYHVAQTYDGKSYRSFVDGIEQGHAYLDFTPQGAGRTSVGMRLNHVNYFKGAIRLARFTRRGLQPNEFLSA